MVIQSLKKKDGSIYTNVELVKAYYEKLRDLQNGVGAATPKEKDRMEDAFYRICGGSQNASEIMAFMKQIYDEPDYDKAQKMLARGLISIQ